MGNGHRVGIAVGVVTLVVMLISACGDDGAREDQDQVEAIAPRPRDDSPVSAPEDWDEGNELGDVPPPRELAGEWRDGDGTRLPDGTNRAEGFPLGVAIYQGFDHCDTLTVSFLEVAWPPGSVTTDVEERRQFVRDTDGSLATAQMPPGDLGDLGVDVGPPPDAEATGLHTDKIELWAAPSDEDNIYVRFGDDTFERWPRADPAIYCE